MTTRTLIFPNSDEILEIAVLEPIPMYIIESEENKMTLYRTKERLQKILLDSMRSILGSNVTCAALKHPSTMTLDDIEANLNLCERLSNAFGAVRALNGYDYPDHQFELSDRNYEA